jgi:hypothetical protein
MASAVAMTSPGLFGSDMFCPRSGLIWPDLVWLACPSDLSHPSGMFLPVLPLAKC